MSEDYSSDYSESDDEFELSSLAGSSSDDQFAIYIDAATFMEHIRRLNLQALISYQKGNLTDEILVSGICVLVQNCTLTCNVGIYIKILLHLQNILFRSNHFWDKCLLRIFTENTHCLNYHLLSFMIKRTEDTYSQLKLLMMMKNANWKQCVQIYQRYQKTISMRQILHLTDSEVLNAYTDRIVASIFRYEIYHEDFAEDISLTKLFNRILSLPLSKSLDIILQIPELDLVSGLCRFGIFQDLIERNMCKIISRLLMKDVILNFYADIIFNLLERDSRIIHSEKMRKILRASIQQKTIDDVREKSLFS